MKAFYLPKWQHTSSHSRDMMRRVRKITLIIIEQYEKQNFGTESVDFVEFCLSNTSIKH